MRLFKRRYNKLLNIMIESYEDFMTILQTISKQINDKSED